MVFTWINTHLRGSRHGAALPARLPSPAVPLADTHPATRMVEVAPPRVVSRSMDILVGGQQRTYLLVCGAVGPGAKAPLKITAVLFVLHGSSQTGQAVRSFSGNSFDYLAETGHVVVVYPDGLKKQWNHNKIGPEATDDVAFMKILTDHFHVQYGPVPVVIAGFSNGGQLVIRLIHEMPDKLHGAAIVGATLPRPQHMIFEQKLAPLPVMLIHGTHDMVVPYRGEGWFGALLGKPRGPSAPETTQYFAARNKIVSAPTHTVLPHRKESGRTSVTYTRFEQDGSPPVALYTVDGGGHVVPNHRRKAIFIAGRTTQDMSVAQALTEFFPVLHS